MRHVRYSIVIPVKDEEECISPLAMEVDRAMAPYGDTWECLWVDDGSTDGTLYLLRSLSQRDPHHRYLSFEQNVGQSAALMAGFKEVRGEIIITLDGDGQNDPADIPRLITELETRGVDMVNGYRQRRRDSLIRRLSSRVANGMRNLITGKTVRDVGCSSRAFKRDCLSALIPFKGMHRFLPTLIHYKGYTWVEIPVNHRPRERGKSKYGISNRLWVGLLDLFGVWWIRVRGFSYVIKESSENIVE